MQAGGCRRGDLFLLLLQGSLSSPGALYVLMLQNSEDKLWRTEEDGIGDAR